MSLDHVLINMAIFLIGQWFLRFYLKRDESSVYIIRYFGYTLIGCGIGVLVPGFLLAYSNFFTTMLVTPGELMFFLVALFGAIGFEIAHVHKRSFSIVSTPNDWGIYAAFTLGGFLLGDTVLGLMFLVLNIKISNTLFWTIVVVASLFGFFVAYITRKKGYTK